jgi:2-keto-4-pentenoate hydratase/2-oxohepta-3-ene-1,7-dioic acid hydratase in catechol pathway
MRFASVGDDPAILFAIQGRRALSLGLASAPFHTLRQIAGSGPDGLVRITAWMKTQPSTAWGPTDRLDRLGPAVPDPGAIYTVGLNYRTADEEGGGPERPLVYGKARTSISGGGVLAWDRSITADVDPEVELGVVIGQPAWRVEEADAMAHVFGYTIVNDVSSRDPWLDGDQWLLGKSMPGFSPVGPWVVTADELDPDDLRLGCAINGEAIQEGRTSDMRFSIAEIVAYLSRHVRLETGDLIATGTPPRLATPPGPDRHLQPGDVVTCWIEGIGELTTTVTR